ncbi:MAG: TatD family hydrolase [Clostridia bacterium]|nr:TatD family hydrolase [Clostridia bacterium]
MRLFDTHAHLLDERFDADRAAVLSAIRQSEVEYVVEIGCDREGFSSVQALCRANNFIYGALGVHPHNADEMNPSVMDELARALDSERIVAVGEIGLDYHYDFSPRETQKNCFSIQLELAAQKKLPVVIHDREAHGDTLDILRAHRDGLGGIMHCFSGSYETARDCIDLGLYIAFGGALTFQNANRLRETAARLPLDRLLIETDCPYMTPVPFRGKRNDPTLMHLTLKTLAETLKIDEERLAETLFENSLRAFNLR